MSDPTTTPTPTEPHHDVRDERARGVAWNGWIDDHWDHGSVTRELMAAFDAGWTAAVSAAATASGQNRSSFATVLAKREADPAWLTRTVEASRAYLDNLPASTRPAWYRARVNGDDAWWESLVQAECDAGHVIFIDDGDGTVYACPACALAEARAALAARPGPTAPLVDLPPATAPVVSGEAVEAGGRALYEVEGEGCEPIDNIGWQCEMEPVRVEYRRKAQAVLTAALGLTVADEVRCGWCGITPTHDPGDCAVAQRAEAQRCCDEDRRYAPAAGDEGGQE
jgi:hypothetical protein